MPRRAPTPCRHPGCAALLEGPGHCDRHRPAVHRNYAERRHRFDAEVGFYQSAAWRACRAAFLQAHPLCCRCDAHGLLVVATVVDHVVPIKDGGARFDWNNLQSLCVSCHNRKTAGETHARRASR